MFNWEMQEDNVNFNVEGDLKFVLPSNMVVVDEKIKATGKAKVSTNRPSPTLSKMKS